MPYSVELWVDDGQPGWSCSCPAGEDGSFCKHCVAVTLLLCASDEDSEEGEQTAPRAARDDPAEMLAAHVAGLDRGRLVELVLDAAGSDWRLRERLETGVSPTGWDEPSRVVACPAVPRRPPPARGRMGPLARLLRRAHPRPRTSLAHNARLPVGGGRG